MTRFTFLTRFSCCSRTKASSPKLSVQAANPNNEEFGEDRLIHLLLANRERSAIDLQRILLEAVASFSGQALQDDATLMIVSRLQSQS